MSIVEMHDWFKLLLDKFNTPYFTDTEIDTFINRAANNYVNQNTFIRKLEENGIAIKSASEFTSNWETLLYPLINADVSVTTSSNKILIADIKAVIASSSTDILAILSLLDPVGNDVKWWRHNNLGAENRNYFTKPSTDYMKYKIANDSLIISPASNGQVFKITTLRTMVPVSKSLNIDCELPLAAHEKIIAMAVDLAKFPTEDETNGGLSQVTD